MRGRTILWCATLCFMYCLCTCLKTGSKPKGFLEAETRVTDLISKLDAVSDHAARAKDEIHSTLRELWQIVDLLGKDRCGDVVERVRTLQRKAAARVEILESEVVELRAKENKLSVEVRTIATERDEAQAGLEEARSAKTKAENEAEELREKVKRVAADKAREGAYKKVLELLGQLQSNTAGRIDVLERVATALSEERQATEAHGAGLTGALEALKAAEGEASGSALDLKTAQELESAKQNIRALTLERDDAVREAAALSRDLKRLKGLKQETKVIFQDVGEASSWTGTLALCSISLATGCLLAYACYGFSGARSPSDDPDPAGAGAGTASTGNSPADKYGSGFGSSTRTPDGYGGSRSSPLTGYMHDSNKSTPMSTTPRLY